MDRAHHQKQVDRSNAHILTWISITQIYPKLAQPDKVFSSDYFFGRRLFGGTWSAKKEAWITLYKAKTLQQVELISRLVECEDEGAVGPRGVGRGGAMELASFSKHVPKTAESRDLQGNLHLLFIYWYLALLLWESYICVHCRFWYQQCFLSAKRCLPQEAR